MTDSGYALLILLMLATVLLISLAAALPSIYTQGQREREEELIFRGNEYARAIAMYRRQFRRFPTSVKDLLQTNGIRFLRRPYTDPMTKHGKWRFIHADASGTPIDSRTFSRPKPAKPLGDSNAASSTSPGGAGGAAGTGSESEQGSESGAEKSSFFGDSKGVQGAFIIGVASMSNKNSIRVYNNKTRYSDWEFLGIEMGGGTVPGQSGGVPAGGPQGSSGGGFGTPGQQGGLSPLGPRSGP